MYIVSLDINVISPCFAFNKLLWAYGFMQAAMYSDQSGQHMQRLI